MSLNSIFTETEIEMILHALRAQETKCKTIANQGITGHGRATELDKRREWADKAQDYRDLESKVAENSI